MFCFGQGAENTLCKVLKDILKDLVLSPLHLESQVIFTVPHTGLYYF